jgi:hypothetical protein
MESPVSQVVASQEAARARIRYAGQRRGGFDMQ